MSAKHIGFNLDKVVFKKAKSKIDPLLFLKELKKFIYYDYELPQDPTAFEEVRYAKQPYVDKLYLQEESVQLLDNYVIKMKNMKVYKANRSLLMRHIIKEFDYYLDHKIIRTLDKPTRSNFTLEKGTSDILDKIITSRDTMHLIDDFIINDYVPNRENLEKDFIFESEKKQFILSEACYNVLQKNANTYHVKKAAIMRDALAQFIEKITHTRFIEYLAEYRIEKAVEFYIEITDQKRTVEKFNELIKKYKGK